MENTQKSHQTPGPFPSPRQGLQNTGETSEVINPAHNQQTRFSESSRSKTQYLPNQTMNFDNILKVYDFDILKQFLEKKVKQFKASSIRFCFEKWKLITSDPEVPQTV